MSKLLPLGGALLLGLVTAGAVLAQGTGKQVLLAADDVIATRQAAFDLMSGTLVGMRSAIDAKAEVKPLADPSRALAAWGRAMPAMFPAGTETGHDTHAKPEIWSDRAGFVAASEGFTAAADKLAQLADANDKDGYAAQYKLVTQSCGGCHRAYKARN